MDPRTDDIRDQAAELENDPVTNEELVAPEDTATEADDSDDALDGIDDDEDEDDVPKDDPDGVS